MLLTQYKEAIENSNIVSKTDTDGVINFVNDEFCSISGYSKDELIGRTHNIVKHPDVPISNFEKLWESITNKETYKATVKNRAKDGSDFYLNTTITPILDEKVYYNINKKRDRLTFLLEQKEYMASNNIIKRVIWDEEVSDERLRTFIRRLRVKTSKTLIINSSGLGYSIATS